MKQKPIYWIDPPDGWRYGFPKTFTLEKDPDWTREEEKQALRQWLIDNGYPIEEIGLWALERMRYGFAD